MMTDNSIRGTLAEAIGTIERTVAHLRLVEHGVGRATIARAREDLSAQAASLLRLRAQLNGDRVPKDAA